MKKEIILTVTALYLLSFTMSILPMTGNADGSDVMGVESNLTDDMQPQGKPAIHGNFVVWTENIFEGGIWNWEIFLYDLSVDSDLDGNPNYLDPDKAQPDPAKVRITYNTSDQLGPKIYANRIVWEDERYGNLDIFMYDLAVDSDDDGMPNYLDSDDDGDGIADLEDPDPDPALVRITDNPAHQEKPAIYGNKIVWVDMRYGNKDIFLYDLNLREEFMVIGYNETGDPRYRPYQNYPSIYGNNLIWQDDRDMNPEIYLYDLSADSDGNGIPNYMEDDRSNDDAERRITSNAKADYGPSIYRDRIAYARADDVYVYDLASGAEYKLTDTQPPLKIHNYPCSIYGSKVVFTYDNGTKDIFMYEMNTDSDSDGVPNYMDPDRPSPDPAILRITNQSEAQIMLPAIHSNNIVWQDSRNTSKPTDRDIYVLTLTENLPPEITLPIPKFNPVIEEGDSMKFLIVANDPEGEELSYAWFMDAREIQNNDTKTLNLKTDFGISGIHEVKVIVSDGEYPIEYTWLLTVTESGIDPIEIVDASPPINPAIIEGESITFSVHACYYNPQDVNVSWTDVKPIDGFEMFETMDATTHSFFGQSGEIDSTATYFSLLKPNGSHEIREINITVNISVGSYHVSHTWELTVLYFEDADFDGYSDSTEIKSSSDPLNRSSNPSDIDHDLIPDIDDDDMDGDGFLDKDKYDMYLTDPKKQVDSNPDISVEIAVLIISVILLTFATIIFSSVRKRFPR